jgi:hypothetical protein
MGIAALNPSSGILLRSLPRKPCYGAGIPIAECVIAMSDTDPERQPSGPWSVPRVQPARSPSRPLPQPKPPRRWTASLSGILFALLLFGGVGARMYKDLSQPDAWDYWKDLYLSPSMTSSVLDTVELDRSGPSRKALAITGEIGAATASWFRERIDEAHLKPGDVVMLSSPGGNLGQSMIMGEIIRAHGLTTVVGAADGDGGIKPSYCASACVLAYAGGTVRVGLAGSRLGVHRFTSASPGSDPVASAQRTMGGVLSYMTKMGVSSTVVEAMAATEKIRWLGAGEAATMNLVTDPAGKG